MNELTKQKRNTNDNTDNSNHTKPYYCSDM